MKVAQITWNSYSKMEVNLYTDSLLWLMRKTEVDALSCLTTTLLVMDANNVFNLMGFVKCSQI